LGKGFGVKLLRV